MPSFEDGEGATVRTMDDISKRVESLRDVAIGIRRELHRYPETAYEETRTAACIAKQLRELGMEVHEGIGVTGVLGVLKGARPGKTVLLRAQMDALAMQAEPEGRPWRSVLADRNHACGHDFNMALVLGAAHVLATWRERFAGQVAFVFQPAEEPQTGAMRMIRDGLFERVKPDFVIAQHAMDNLPPGKVVAQAGPIWASVDVLKLTIHGERTELDVPHGGADAMLMAAEAITSLYAMAHREHPLQEPVLLRVTSIAGRSGPGQPTAEIGIRLSTYNRAVQEAMVRRIGEVASGVVAAMRGTCALENTHSLPPIVNHPVPAQALIDAARETVGAENVVDNWRNTFPEDFAWFMERAPGAVFGVGTNNPAKGTGRFHAPDYDVDDDAVPIGVEVTARAALKLLRGV